MFTTCVRTMSNFMQIEALASWTCMCCVELFVVCVDLFFCAGFV